MKFRIEKDSLGNVKVPAKALWGAQTQRAVDNFPISGIKMDFPFTKSCLLYTSPSPRDLSTSRMPSSA